MALVSKTPHQLSQKTLPSLAQYQFFQQKQERFQLQHQQKMKVQAEMMYLKSSSGINLKFDTQSCTPTMSSNKSIISSLSMDGSVTSLDGKSFSLTGVLQSSSSQQNSKQKPKMRKLRVKRSIKVPAMSNKIADIPF